MLLPKIIQGGMGVGVSDWKLASAVAKLGQLGVVSGTALDVVLARRLQLGDPCGSIRKALAHFPIPAMAERVINEYFIDGGKPEDQPFKQVPLFTVKPTQGNVELAVLGNYVEVFLAKVGHAGQVGINFLEKIQMPTLPAIFGAILAGVDCVLMGAGIPRAIPGILDDLVQGKPVQLKLDVEGVHPDEEVHSTFDPVAFCGGILPVLRRPMFIAIISSATLAMTLAKKSTGHVDGFIVEGATAGGHNAPPRGAMQLNEKGEPIYGIRDVPDLVKIKEQGIPFWLAGSYGQPGKLAEALSLGAAGIQVGTAFAFCDESGIAASYKKRVIELSRAGQLAVLTDPLASPTGFPFKVVQVEGSVADPSVYTERTRLCDLGFLRHPYRKQDGTIGYRCAAESVEGYVRKGGQESETVGRKCVCNGLFGTIGMGQSVRSGNGVEAPLFTAGDDVVRVAEYAKTGADSYTAADVISRLLDC